MVFGPVLPIFKVFGQFPPMFMFYASILRPDRNLTYSRDETDPIERVGDSDFVAKSCFFHLGNLGSSNLRPYIRPLWDHIGPYPQGFMKSTSSKPGGAAARGRAGPGLRRAPPLVLKMLIICFF